MNLFVKNIRQLVTVAANGSRTKRGVGMREIGIIENGAVLCREGKIAWVGHDDAYPGKIENELPVLDASGLVALPGFVDAHTHTVFAGSREGEFDRRNVSR